MHGPLTASQSPVEAPTASDPPDPTRGAPSPWWLRWPASITAAVVVLAIVAVVVVLAWPR